MYAQLVRRAASWRGTDKLVCKHTDVRPAFALLGTYRQCLWGRVTSIIKVCKILSNLAYHYSPP